MWSQVVHRVAFTKLVFNLYFPMAIHKNNVLLLSSNSSKIDFGNFSGLIEIRKYFGNKFMLIVTPYDRH